MDLDLARLYKVWPHLKWVTCDDLSWYANTSSDTLLIKRHLCIDGESIWEARFVGITVWAETPQDLQDALTSELDNQMAIRQLLISHLT